VALRHWFDRFATGWLVGWLSLIAIYIHFGGLAFAGLAILLGAVGWIVWWQNRMVMPMLRLIWLRPLILFMVFFIWLGLSALWGESGPGTAFRLGGQMLLALSIPAFILTRTVWVRSALAHIIMAMALAGVAIMAMDVAAGYGINTFLDPVAVGEDLNARQGDAEKNIGRGHIVYAVLAPIILSLFATRLPKGRAGPAALVFIALLVIGTWLNRLAVVPLILLGALFFMWLGYRSPKWGLRLSLGTLAASIAFAPLVGFLSRWFGPALMQRLPMSWDHRLRMWDYSLARIAEAPLIGQGLDSSRNLQDDFTTRIGVDLPFISLHPHNIGLQTWLETGLVGALLLSVSILCLYRPLSQLKDGSPWRAAALSGLIMAISIASAVTVGAWQYWWWGLIAIAFAMMFLIPAYVTLSVDDIVRERDNHEGRSG
jgi:O-antigen ligase